MLSLSPFDRLRVTTRCCHAELVEAWARHVLTAALAIAVALAPAAAWAGGSAAEVDANARAAGNRRADAVALGTVLFGRVRPAQVVKVRIDGAMSHEVAGLVLSGVKFHGPLSVAGFEGEVIDLVRTSFAASRVEEVDCWATVPLPVDRRMVVSGDMAQPSSRTVFAVTVRRSEGAGFAARLRRGAGVYWEPAFRARLAALGGPGASGSRGQT
jgi:hypothetical protein